MSPEEAAKLRVPFPPEQIGKLPRGGVELDYVGHAAVTDRLLAVDPEWTWRPLAYDAQGLPALDADGNLWILITVCGVQRVAVGDGKNAKERISDAIRNGAMRFGVALDLWSKQDLDGDLSTVASLGDRQRAHVRSVADAPTPEPDSHRDSPVPDDERPPLTDDASFEDHPEKVITHGQRRRLFAIAREHGVTEEHLRDLLLGMTGSESTSELTVGRYEELVAFISSRSAHA